MTTMYFHKNSNPWKQNVRRHMCVCVCVLSAWRQIYLHAGGSSCSDNGKMFKKTRCFYNHAYDPSHATCLKLIIYFLYICSCLFNVFIFIEILDPTDREIYQHCFMKCYLWVLELLIIITFDVLNIFIVNINLNIRWRC